ncbi:alpha-mannosidase 2-like [Artemia franciscana]|uniref:alpha-mannosidase 2-like n=1 Tax=Artemia franciscana TaxID=6661 RepID=UPI0032DA6B94
MNMLREYAAFIALPLSSIINECFASGFFLSQWKRAYIRIIRKKRAPSACDDLRPISLTPCLAKRAIGKITENDCPLNRIEKKKTDLQMKDVYSKIRFENRDGGAWKQGWDITYDDFRSRWDRGNKLKVFVVPHSHNDPGWIKTYEQYYQGQTRHIFNNMINKLGEDKGRKFIWAEISYLYLFWNESSDETKAEIIRLVNNGQLEIVTGGWVMNDEANSHYYAIIEQMAAGHEWLTNNLNIKPKNGWAIDPFGLSPTMAYLLQRMGLEQMVIQRGHYEVKKAFAWNKTLEFRWRQTWDPKDSTDILAHLMPFYSYDVPHTCGPDPKVCCQFDFRRLTGSGLSCPWRVPPILITPENIEQRAYLLLDQYRKKSTFFKTNALLVPLGDDFRYNTEGEWDAQFKNYKKLFEYMNAQEDWHVQAQFGTLADYFEEVHQESARLSPIGMSDASQFFPSFAGDFFTYADERDHYWSGYYTSRPFYKNLDRYLEHYLRSADILFSMMWSHVESIGFSKPSWTTELTERLTSARRNLSLFQHHDGITGTARDHVVNDYGNKLFQSILNVKSVISQTSDFLLCNDQVQYSPNIQKVHFVVDDINKFLNNGPQRKIVSFDGPSELVRVIFFNSLPRSREEVVHILVSSSNVKVLDRNRKPVPFQINPQFFDGAEISNSAFELSFLIEVRGLGLTTYFLLSLDDNEEQDAKFCSVAKIKVFGTDAIPFSVNPFSDVVVVDTTEPFRLKNRYISATFGENGLLKSIKVLDDEVEHPVELNFVQYGVRKSSPTSRAYLFFPDGPAINVKLRNPSIRIVEGPIMSSVHVQFEDGLHEVRVVDSPGSDGIGLGVVNYVDITQRYNYELAMRFSTHIENYNVFFSDLNGFQMIRRVRQTKLPLQANFFPMPALAFIEDGQSCLTLVSGQPLGVSSQASGKHEVMLDRRLGQDDRRGLGQGVTDKIKFTPLKFLLLFEKRKKDCHSSSTEGMDSYSSIASHLMAHSLFYPLIKMFHEDVLTRTTAEDAISLMKTELAPSQSDLACDIHLVHLRTSTTQRNSEEREIIEPSEHLALTVHRLGFDCCFKPLGAKCRTTGGKFSVMDLFPEYLYDSVEQTSLTLLHSRKELRKSFTTYLKPMELYTFLLKK